MINKKVINLAYKLKNNAIKTGNRFWMASEFTNFILDYEINEEYLDNEEMLAVLTRIVEDGFNMNDWELCEIPIDEVYCFCNKDETKFFDMELIQVDNPDIDGEWYWKAYPSYVDENRQEHKAKTIEDAIEKYVPIT